MDYVGWNTIEKKKPGRQVGEQANRAKKEKVLNGQFQFNQFSANGQQFGENFLSRAHARAKSVCSVMNWNEM